MIYSLLLIPFLLVLAIRIFKSDMLKQLVWWEYAVYYVANFFLIVFIDFLFGLSASTGTQYYNGYVTHARYTQYYSTWVVKECSRQVPDGETCDSDGKNCQTKYRTEYYDCSYCDENDPYWRIFDNRGNTYSITEGQYKRLVLAWGNSKFIELNRDIDHHGSCGVDGDAYETYWNNDPLTAKLTVEAKSYENKLLSNKELTTYSDVTKDDISRLGLYDYPSITDMDGSTSWGGGYYQKSVLGMEKCGFKPADILKQIQYIDFLNGVSGEKHKIKIFVLFYNSQVLEPALMQEAYWTGGNQNELVICVGANGGKLNWVKAFSPTYNRRILVDIREDLMEKPYSPETFYKTIEQHVPKFSVRNFKEDFDYVVYEESTWCYIVAGILSAIASVVMLFFFMGNEHYNDDEFEDGFGDGPGFWKSIWNTIKNISKNVYVYCKDKILLSKNWILFTIQNIKKK